MNVQAQDVKLEAQVIIRDKDGNVKYQGPLVLTPLKEQDNGGNAQHSG